LYPKERKVEKKKRKRKEQGRRRKTSPFPAMEPDVQKWQVSFGALSRLSFRIKVSVSRRAYMTPKKAPTWSSERS